MLRGILKKRARDDTKCSDLSEEICGESRRDSHTNVPEVMELTKILKVFLESHVEKVGQICTDCLGGGRMVMAKSLFKIV